jgi:hypothetical protein
MPERHALPLYNFGVGTFRRASMEQAYAAIGRAVLAMQMFEAAFVSIHEGFKMINDEAYREATGARAAGTQ